MTNDDQSNPVGRFVPTDYTNFQLFYEWLIPLAEEFYRAKYWGFQDQNPDIQIIHVDEHEVCFKAYYLDKWNDVDCVGIDLSVEYLMNEEKQAAILNHFRIQRQMVELENQLKAKEIADYDEQKERELYEQLKQKFDK